MEPTDNLNDEMEQLVECIICRGRLNNPKVLKCGHSFCKTCLDRIIQFLEDGSAYINCPLRCSKKTIIDREKTTNDLQAPVQFKNVIDYLAEKNDVTGVEDLKYKCHEFPKCEKRLSFFCPVCCVKLCCSCKTKHTHDSQPIGFVPVKYTPPDDDELLPWCEKHATCCTYVCQDGYICIYCAKREHSTHRCGKIKTLSQQITDWVHNQEGDYSDLHDMVQSSKTQTEEEIARIRDELKSEMKNRKLMSIKKLCEEEEKLLRKFDSIIADHLSSYPPSQPSDCIESKSSFEIYADRSNIYKGVKNLSTTAIVLPRVSLTLTEESINAKHPLGKIQTYKSVTKLVDNEITASVSIAETPRIQGEELDLLVREFQLKLPVQQAYSTINVKSIPVIEASSGQPVIDSSSGFHKQSGPVNGNECYFWRTTGCNYANKCRYKHIPANKGSDLQKMHAKYGEKPTVS